MTLKKWILVLFIAICGGIVALTFFHKTIISAPSSTQNVLDGMDVTNLSDYDVRKADENGKDWLYTKRTVVGKSEFDIKSVGVEDNKDVQVLYEIESLYNRGNISGLYESLDFVQLEKDGITDFTQDDLKKYLEDLFNDKDMSFFQTAKTYESEKLYDDVSRKYSVISFTAVNEKKNIADDQLYDYENGKKLRFTVWISKKKYTWVPYSIVEGIPVEIRANQDSRVSLSDKKEQQTKDKKIDSKKDHVGNK